LPQDLAALLQKMRIRDTLAFVAILQSFPSALAVHLHWNAATVAKATAGALHKLKVAGQLTQSPALAAAVPYRRAGLMHHKLWEL
jgi:hypothetical protein